VLHIMTPRSDPYPHKPSSGLTVIDDKISYPGGQPELFQEDR